MAGILRGRKLLLLLLLLFTLTTVFTECLFWVRPQLSAKSLVRDIFFTLFNSTRWVLLQPHFMDGRNSSSRNKVTPRS